MTLNMANFSDLSYSWLDDFDWSLRMVMSSDKLSDLHRKLLMLKLETTDANGEKAEHLIELTSEELKYLIAKLKSVQKVCSIIQRSYCTLCYLIWKQSLIFYDTSFVYYA